MKINDYLNIESFSNFVNETKEGTFWEDVVDVININFYIDRIEFDRIGKNNRIISCLILMEEYENETFTLIRNNREKKLKRILN